jgi:flagellar L-ring protein precursor FlgH
MTRLLCIVALIGVLVTLSVTRADSIWDRRDPRYVQLFTDNRARRPGDVLTVIIRESTDIRNRDEREMNKDTNAQFNYGHTGSMSGNKNSSKTQASLQAQLTSKREFEGKAEFTSDRRLEDRMTVVVVDVMPNGNMIVEGYRKRVVSGEMRVLRISGVVRPPDVSEDNSVQSSLIANFVVQYEGKGPETSYTSNGWLGKIGNVLWPF